MEAANRGRKATVHRRGETVARDAHEGTPGLQVSAAPEAKTDPARWLPVPDDVPIGARRCTASW